MVHFPGIRSDFDRWEQEGALGWGYNDIRPIIERVTCERPQDLMPRYSCPRTSYKIAMLGTLFVISLVDGLGFKYFCFSGETHSLPQRTKKCVPTIRLTGGEPTSETLTKAFIDAGRELGGDSSKNEETAEKGFRNSRSSIWNGRRWSTLESYLRPALGRENLHVMLNTHVGRVRLLRSK